LYAINAIFSEGIISIGSSSPCCMYYTNTTRTVGYNLL
jgi:hypothetical protein